jgi:hypothetical protein
MMNMMIPRMRQRTPVARPLAAAAAGCVDPLDSALGESKGFLDRMIQLGSGYITPIAG